MKFWSKGQNVYLILLGVLTIVVTTTGFFYVSKQKQPLGRTLPDQTEEGHILDSVETDLYKVLPSGDRIGEPIGRQKIYSYVAEPLSDTIPQQARDMIEKRDGITLVSEVMERRTANGRVYEKSDGSFAGQFISGDTNYYKDDVGDWFQVNYGTTTVEEFEALPKGRDYILRERAVDRNPILNFFMPLNAYADTFNPSASAIDGAVGARENSADYDAAHDATDGLVADDTGQHLTALIGVGVNFRQTSARWQIDRGVIGFPTGSLPDVITVTSATVDLYRDDDTDCLVLLVSDTDEDTMFIVHSDDIASETAIGTADYDKVGDAVDNPTRLSDTLEMNDLTDDAFNTWTLNSTGEAFINTTGNTMLGLRISADDGTDPGWTTNERNSWGPCSSRVSGTSKDPLLTVNFTEGGGEGTPGIPNFFIKGDVFIKGNVFKK